MANERNGKGNNNGNKSGNKNGNGNRKVTKQILEESSELIVIALLLAGELKLDSILLDRDSTIQVILEGKLRKGDHNNADKLADFMQENGSITLDDIVEGLRRRMGGR